MDIRIRGARVHNLKNVHVNIPKGKMTVITGLSGSGKSSLAFDTLFAEGQRRYVESLSSYARQFLGRLDKPDVDGIDGITPAIAIEQRTSVGGPRSTVGTRTELQDHLRLLFARIGRTIDPVTGREVMRDRPTDVAQWVAGHEEGRRFLVTAPLQRPAGKSAADWLELLRQQGFSRVLQEDQSTTLDDLLEGQLADDLNRLELVIDRLTVDPDPAATARLADSLETAFFEGRGTAYVVWADTFERRGFNDRFEIDGRPFIEPTPELFAFQSPVGACPRCEGFGTTIGIDPALVIPDPRLTLYEDAVAPWRGEQAQEWKQQLCLRAASAGLSIHTPWSELTEQARDMVWNGHATFQGIHAYFAHLEAKSYKIQNRVQLSRFRGKTTCPDCKGSRLRPEAHWVQIHGTSLPSLLLMPIHRVLSTLDGWRLSPAEEAIAQRLLLEIRRRLGYLCDVGLDYLTLNRQSNTLSGGESQRIALTACLGSSLVGSTYVLDEPSIGLHPQDTQRLLRVMHGLRDLGNTVLVVEHDDEVMAAADHLIDMGPDAGALGGQVVFEGPPAACAHLPSDHPSHTAAYLSGRNAIPLPPRRRPTTERLEILHGRGNNIEDLSASIPLYALTAITGVSGSGKSTFAHDILVPLLEASLQGLEGLHQSRGELRGAVHRIGAVERVDQNPIGKSSRSNPATYVKAFDDIRNLLADTPTAKMRAYKPGLFSFNVPGGRCETCEGEGTVTIGMQFMADIQLPCDVCKGKRFQEYILAIRWQDKNIDDILNMTIQEAVDFFETHLASSKTHLRKALQKLQPLLDVGLGYVRLGQSASTFSGGEAQRIKLAAFLNPSDRSARTLFLFDEPTTGLHVHDVRRLLDAFDALLAQGHTVVVIEHHTEVIVHADHVIEMGPGGGEHGGKIIFQGTPEALAEHAEAPTAPYVRKRLTSRK